MTPEEKHNRLTYTYMDLRKAVGVISILLPFVLLTGLFIYQFFLEGNEALAFHYPESISHYYYSILRGVFVGALCAIALFMFFYRGYDKGDNVTGNLAGFFVLGVAWFPTSEGSIPTSWIAVVHYASSSLFFICLAYFSIRLFTKTKEGGTPTPEKLKRNKIYRICGWFIVFCLVCMAAYSFIIKKQVHIHYFMWIGETLSLFAFGISWLTKGGAIYRDHMVEHDESQGV